MVTRGIPFKGLALLTIAVVAAHLAVLQAGTLSAPRLMPPAALTAQPFITRTLASAPVSCLWLRGSNPWWLTRPWRRSP